MSQGSAEFGGPDRHATRLRGAFWILAVLVFVSSSLILVRATLLDARILPVLFAGAVGGILVLTRPGYIVYILALLIPLTSGTARGAFIPFFRANEIMLLMLTCAALAIFLVRRRAFRITWLDKLLLGYLGIRVGVPIVTSLVWGYPLEMKVLFGPIQYYLLFRVVVECVDHEFQVRRAVFMMLLASMVVAGVGFLQALQVPGINEFLAAYFPAERDAFTYTFLASPRVTSLFAGDWNGCGLYMAMSVVLGLGTVHLFQARWQRVVIIIVVFLDLITVFLTASFTGLLCMVIGVGLLFALSEGTRGYLKTILYVLPILVLLLSTIFWNIVSNRLEMQFGASASSLIPHTWKVRVFLWREVMWPYITDNWLWGLGTIRLGWSVFESYYVFLMLTVGIFGLLAYLVLSLGVLLNLRPYLGRWDWQGGLALVGGIFVVQIMIANLSGGYFEFSGVTETLWLMLGFLIAGEIRRKSATGIRPNPPTEPRDILPG